MKVLVVGGTGAIGTRAVRALQERGHDVRATARGPEKARTLSKMGVEPVDIDIFSVDALRAAMRGSDAVVRLTTKIGSSFNALRAKANWEETNRLREIGSKRIVDAAQAEGVGIYVQESFYSVYRDAGSRWVDEGFPSDDGSLDTMRAILASEDQAARMTRLGGKGVTLRFGGYYSADNSLTESILTMVRKRMMPQIGQGMFYISPLDLDDAGRAVEHALRAPSGIYNVCDDEPLRFKDYLSVIATAAGAPRPMRLPGALAPLAMGYPWAWLSRSLRLSNRHFKNVTGWEPRVRNAIEGWRVIAAR